jgi:hypothetical protein
VAAGGAPLAHAAALAAAQAAGLHRAAGEAVGDAVADLVDDDAWAMGGAVISAEHDSDGSKSVTAMAARV